MYECVTVPIFDIDIHVFTDRDEAKAFHATRCPSEPVPEELDASRGVCITNEKCRMLCVFEPAPHIIVHESVHMAWEILAECRIKTNQANDEPLAYLASWLSCRVMTLAGVLPK